MPPSASSLPIVYYITDPIVVSATSPVGLFGHTNREPRPRRACAELAKTREKYSEYCARNPYYGLRSRKATQKSVSEHFRKIPAREAWPSPPLGRNRVKKPPIGWASPNRLEFPLIVPGVASRSSCSTSGKCRRGYEARPSLGSGNRQSGPCRGCRTGCERP